MNKPWSREEFASLLDCLRRHSRGQDAVQEHNGIWKTGRTTASCDHKIRSEGRGNFGNYLRISAQRKDDIPPSDMVKKLVEVLRRSTSASVSDICNVLDVSPRRLEGLVILAKNSGYRVEMPTGDILALNVKAPPIDRLAVHRIPILPVQDHIRFAVASDLHFASKLQRRECLVDFVDLAYSQGIRRILVPGDVVAGVRMYPGQPNEVTTSSMEGQVREVVRGLPRREGLAYDMIGGNHDESFMKSCGADVIGSIGQQRKDIRTYNYYSALFDIGAPDVKHPVKIELHHPDKAGAYAMSYHIQKEIEQIPPGMKPQLIFMGHTHQAILLPDYRNVAAFYCGTFEDQTLYLKRKHVSPQIGGWVVDMGVTTDGSLKTLTVTWVKYFHSRRGSIRCRDWEQDDGEVRMERSLGVPIGF